ncbi:glycosyltransferase involved in cell wall biosynthesis [Roseibium hamelinense]|uniref:Glycosyltransferase involved in cell wall biosynthesis n=1 Tax=Roseibium hamelinense TaxID=150831 RepID=A0A562T396_9HYPH|nr:glycosyltransferase family 1 protein [Roseibium hamelinense]MTI44449.1 glycosyltransferase family 1 protein [Roseibium hamelinense]TWI87416.1 glycosyltransferase involved in cell wall biosynthesis [Roseibium hamelinense]
MTRILYDTYNIVLPTGTGVATYARALIKTVSEMGYTPELIYDFHGPVPKDLRLAKSILFEDMEKLVPANTDIRQAIESATRLHNSGRTIKLPEESYLFEEPIRNRMTSVDTRYIAKYLYARAGHHFRTRKRFYPLRFDTPPDIAHFTFQLPVTVKKSANIYTIHDLVPLILPYATLENRRRTFRIFKEIAKKADHIVTVSEQSRNDIIRILGVEEDRVTNTYQAVALPPAAKNKKPDEVADEVSGIFGVQPNDYYLFYGAIEPKKNLRRLIEAYLSSRVKRPLVIVSSGGWQNKAEKQMIKDNPLRPDGSGIIPLGYLPYEFLISLIKGARAVLFPSLYEGFGLPALEAMALGTTVLTSKGSSLTEVAGDAAVMVNPVDIKSIRDGILQIDKDDRLVDELRQRGIGQADKFSQERYKERLKDLYAKLA